MGNLLIIEREIASDQDQIVLSVSRRYTDFELFYQRLLETLPLDVFIIPKLPAKTYYKSEDMIRQRMQDLEE